MNADERKTKEMLQCLLGKSASILYVFCIVFFGLLFCIIIYEMRHFTELVALGVSIQSSNEGILTVVLMRSSYKPVLRSWQPLWATQPIRNNRTQIRVLYCVVRSI